VTFLPKRGRQFDFLGRGHGRRVPSWLGAPFDDCDTFERGDVTRQHESPGPGSNAASGRGSPRVWPAQRTWVGVVSERRHSEAPEDKSKKVRWRRAAVWLPAEFHKEKRPEAGEVKWRTHSKRAGGRTRLSRDLLAFLGLAASWAWLPYRLRGSYPSPRRSLLGPKFQPLASSSDQTHFAGGEIVDAANYVKLLRGERVGSVHHRRGVSC
jgi:hypothetical protein